MASWSTQWSIPNLVNDSLYPIDNCGILSFFFQHKGIPSKGSARNKAEQLPPFKRILIIDFGRSQPRADIPAKMSEGTPSQSFAHLYSYIQICSKKSSLKTLTSTGLSHQNPQKETHSPPPPTLMSFWQLTKTELFKPAFPLEQYFQILAVALWFLKNFSWFY